MCVKYVSQLYSTMSCISVLYMLNVAHLCVNCKEEAGIMFTLFQRKGGVMCTPTLQTSQTGMD